MREYVLLRYTPDGEEELIVRTDYDLIDAVNKLAVMYLTVLVMHKVAKGPVRWHKAAILGDDIRFVREAEAYVERSN